MSVNRARARRKRRAWRMKRRARLAAALLSPAMGRPMPGWKVPRDRPVILDVLDVEYLLSKGAALPAAGE